MLASYMAVSAMTRIPHTGAIIYGLTKVVKIILSSRTLVGENHALSMYFTRFMKVDGYAISLKPLNCTYLCNTLERVEGVFPCVLTNWSHPL